MSALVSPSRIEEIVGVKRHRQTHYGRAVSDEQTIYVLHSQRCLDSGIDLRECRFSVAMDSGIEPQVWDDLQDRPVILGVEHGCLVPLAGTGATSGTPACSWARRRITNSGTSAETSPTTSGSTARTTRTTTGPGRRASASSTSGSPKATSRPVTDSEAQWLAAHRVVIA